MTTDTPRTDAFCPNHEAAIADPTHAAKRASGLKAIANGLWKRVWQKHPKISDEFFIAHEVLEVASDQMHKLEAEIAKLNHQLLKTESDLIQSQDINSFLDAEFRIACKRAEKAEAEVKSLTKALESCWHAANTYDGNYTRACDNVAMIAVNALNPQDNLIDK